MAGRVLGGRYTVQDKIGTGGMATVYRGVDEVLGRTVAIKTITLAAALDSGVATLDSTYSAPASLPVDDSQVTNIHDDEWESLTLREALMYSANTVYAQVGMDLGASAPMKAQVATSKAASAVMGPSTRRRLPRLARRSRRHCPSRTSTTSFTVTSSRRTSWFSRTATSR